MTRAIFPKGSKPEIRHIFTREKLYVFGALSKDSFDSVLADKLNTETYLQYLHYLLRKYEKIVIVIDSVSYHRSKKAKKFYEENKQRLKMIYLPKYSPDMNPAEQTWKKIKGWLATRIWFNKIELEEQLVYALNNPIFMSKIYDYLMH